MKIFLLMSFLIISTGLFSCSKQTSPKVSGVVPEPAPRKQEMKAGWELEWAKAMAEAKKEGRVIVFGPPGSDIRRAMTEEFQKSYPGIQVEWVGATGSAQVPRVKAERRAGLYNVDISIGGTTSIVSELMQFAIPIKPFLILPEVKEEKYWVGGKLDFADKEEKYNLVFTTYGKVAMAYNTSLVSPAKVKDMSYWDLAAPEFKGKIIMDDPRGAGPGQATALFYYLEPRLGRNFLKALAANEITFTRDSRLLLEWVSRGKYAVAIGHSELMLNELQRAGLRDLTTQPTLKEGTFAPNGFGSLMVFDKAPHPNASSIYTNWLLSREGQIIWAKVNATPSRRTDLPQDIANPELFLKPGVSYIFTYKEEVIMKRAEVIEAIYEIFGRS